MERVCCENALSTEKAQVFVVNANRHPIRASTGELFVWLISKCVNGVMVWSLAQENVAVRKSFVNEAN
jgi:hypothetical protein